MRILEIEEAAELTLFVTVNCRDFLKLILVKRQRRDKNDILLNFKVSPRFLSEVKLMT
jgi:hypothetical protein